jgi:hypothetical protein
MKNIIKATTMAVLAATLSFGQTQKVSKSQGYVYQGFSGDFIDGSGAVGNTGVGGEGVFWKGISAGGDISGVYPFRCLSCIIGVVDLNGGFHFNAGRTDRKLEPFVTAGYSFYFRGDSASGSNFGGGIVYWFKPKLGLRFEVREHRIQSSHAFTQFRIGLSFR